MSLLPYASLSHRRKSYRATGAVVLLSSQTADDDATISFTSLPDHGELIFRFYAVQPATDEALLTFQTSTDNSSYGMTTTTSYFRAFHNESGVTSALEYEPGADLAQSTSFIKLTENTGSAADECCAGELHFFSNLSTTYVKHFYATLNTYTADVYTRQTFVAGYINDTDDVTALQFKFSTGNINAGTIKAWGVKN
jgi:hypothetical protein